MARERRYTFTELLYVIVIGSAFTRLDPHTPRKEAILLILALLIVFDDYLLYNLEVEEMERKGKNFVLWFWLDMLVLASWYITTLATKYSEGIFFLSLGLFFLCTTMWEFVFSTGSLWKRIVAGDAPLVFASVAVGMSALYLRGSYWLSLTIFVAVAIWWRWPSWAHLWRLGSHPREPH